MKNKVIYACPFCHRTYDTAEAAEACAKWPADHYQLGDLVWDGTSPVYQIYELEKGVYGAGVKRVIEYDVADQGRKPSKLNDAIFLVGGFWCRSRQFTEENAKLLVRQVAREVSERMEAAKRLVAMTKQAEAGAK